MANGEHTAERPDWTCRACGDPWPCAPAKVELTEDYRRFPSSLVVYLAAHLTDAIDDLAAGRGGIPPDLYDRFVGWAR
jgi:hypothetical protein